jgi:hypothetical protein
MQLTPYHARFLAYELTRRCASDSDQLKSNAVQTFKTKGVLKFQTV